MPDSPVDILLGTGGAPEGVISAAALKCLGGDFQGRLNWRNDEEIERARTMGIKDPNAVYMRDELVRGDNVIFCATGVTDGEMLKGVQFTSTGAHTHSVVMRAKTGTVRYVHAQHHFNLKPKYS